ncbi:MAG TPA: lipoyl synthase [Chloroflexota bacterium]
MTDLRKPAWLLKRVAPNASIRDVRTLLRQQSLHTVCESAMCPNLGECFSRRTATFLILGDTCTRNCGYCAVTTGRPGALDTEEPERVAEAAANLQLRHVVVTSVTRDDLPDGGAAHFARTITALKRALPSSVIEVLIPDFRGSETALGTVIDAEPDVLNHNVETVPSLFKSVRPQGSYARSIELLSRARRAMTHGYVKSGLMVGLGETEDEVMQVMRDLRGVGCDIFTAGQYLRPSKAHLEVKEYWPPDKFERLKKYGESIGFVLVAAAPYVRSSYMADQLEMIR